MLYAETFKNICYASIEVDQLLSIVNHQFLTSNTKMFCIHKTEDDYEKPVIYCARLEVAAGGEHELLEVDGGRLAGGPGRLEVATGGGLADASNCRQLLVQSPWGSGTEQLQTAAGAESLG